VFFIFGNFYYDSDIVTCFGVFVFLVIYNHGRNFTTTWELGYVMCNEQQFYVL